MIVLKKSGPYINEKNVGEENARKTLDALRASVKNDERYLLINGDAGVISVYHVFGKYCLLFSSLVEDFETVETFITRRDLTVRVQELLTRVV